MAMTIQRHWTVPQEYKIRYNQCNYTEWHDEDGGGPNAGKKYIKGICETRQTGGGMRRIHQDYQLICKGMENKRKYGAALIPIPSDAE